MFSSWCPIPRKVLYRCASGAAPPLWPRPPPAQVHKPEVRSPPRCRVAGGPGPRCSRSGAPWKLGPWRHQPNFQPMATPGLGLLWVLGLALLPTRWGRAWGENSTSTPASLTQEPNDFSSNGGLSQEGLTAIIVVFSILGALVVVSGLVFMVQKLREKRQTEGTYRPSNEEQFSHAAEARAPQDSKETVRGCLPI
ncbi:protein crumbs homolog 3 isoform X1 [Heterocephalus glaber]|uniref:Protein crumbs homolog 3 isoform X1 n=2 Tax=Heterocephalus glaber TaxID=10181 RepID=A0AAX6Q572_HETGA|nr:protein crumbs homolog 3 isoform X1 [Heterocephalus glaber]